MCMGASSINHLLFIDDSIIFYKANVDTTKKVQSLLSEYEATSRQCINSNKIAMIFSKNTPSHTRIEEMALWSNEILQQYEKYLGLPSIIGKAKRNAFLKIKDKMQNKLNTWKKSNLSQGGKEVLIKTVALSISTYAMSCFKLSDSLCRDLEGMMACYWWGQKGEECNIY